MAFGHKDKSLRGLSRTLDKASTGASLNQIRGISTAGAQGAGIPKQVTNVTVSIAPASSGSTTAVTVLFHRDPTDANFSTANVYVRGYNSNPSNVQIASGATSPITFILNNTGESVAVTVQASGNSGDAPIANSPNAGVKLPLSASGYGVNSAVGLSGSGIAGALASWTGKTSLGPTNLGGDAVTTNNTNAKVVGIQTVPVSNSTPNTGDTFRYNEYGDSKWDVTIGSPRFIGVVADGANNPFVVGYSGVQPVTIGTRSLNGPTSTEMPADTYASAATASLNIVALIEWGFGASTGSYCLGTFRRYSTRARANQTTNCRFFIGLGKTSPQFGTAAYSTDTPNFPAVYFRYSSGTDSTWKAVCCVDSAHQSVSDTGIAVDTVNSQLFDIAAFASGYRFYINGTLVATITTNLPSASDLWGTLLGADNKNTANAVSATLWYSTIVTK